MRSVGERIDYQRAKERFIRLKSWQRWGIVGIILGLIVAGIVLARGGDEALEDTSSNRTVTLATVSELSGGLAGSSLYGTVQSTSEARLYTQTAGIVESVRTRVGATVPAGYIIAELSNASEEAAVLQAQGGYEGALAARSAQSTTDARTRVIDLYRSTYTLLDTTLESDVDTLFGGPTGVGPEFLINSDERAELSRARENLDARIRQYEANLARASTRTPETLLDEAEGFTLEVQAFVLRLSDTANENGSDASPQQLAALDRARAAIDSQLSQITAARIALRSTVVSATASAAASVKQALGGLRAAQAQLEKTRVRATIAGTINYLPIKTGEYVQPFTQVGTVAQNGALEVVTYITEDDRNLLTAGMNVTIDETASGIVTSIAPALDPVTRQIEVRIAVAQGTNLINGQSVRIGIPGAPADTAAALLLPLESVKLRGEDRVVFTIDGEGRIMTYPVTTGEVRGARIEITSPLPRDLRIISDARGLSEGQVVQTAEAK